MIRELNVFLSLPDSLLDEALLKQMKATLLPAYSEKATKVFCCAKKRKYLIQEIKDLEDEALTTRVRTLLADINDYQVKTDGSSSYYQWSTYEIMELNRDSTICEVTERILENTDLNKKLFVLCNFRPLPILTSRSYISVLKDNPRDNDLPILAKIPCIQLSEKIEIELEEWIKNYRQKRVFIHNPKHPRGGTEPVSTTVSTLLWLAKDDATIQDLLNNALGDYSISRHTTLYNWDKDKGCYIIFEDDNTAKNSYHAYHLHPSGVERKFLGIKYIKTRLDLRK